MIWLLMMMLFGFAASRSGDDDAPSDAPRLPPGQYSETAARQAALTIQRLYPAMTPDQQRGRVHVPVVETAQRLMGLSPDGRIGPDTRARMADLGSPI